MTNDSTSNSASPQQTSGSRRVIGGKLLSSPTFPAPEEDKVALVATLAPFPRSESILRRLTSHAEGLGYEVFARVAISEGDGELFYPSKRARDAGLEIFMDDSPAPEWALASATAWRDHIMGVPLEVVDLEGQEVAPSPGAAVWPVVPIQKVMDDCEAELRYGGGDKAREKTITAYRKIWVPFKEYFKVFPGEWGVIRKWLDDLATEKVWASRTRLNRQVDLSRLYSHGVVVMKRNGVPVLPQNPMRGVGLPSAESALANPLTWEDQSRIDALDMSPRDRCIWHLEYGHGWRPVSCEDLVARDVREAAHRDDGFIWRTQKKREGKPTTAKAPILAESLQLLLDLADLLKLPDEAPVFRGRRGDPLGEEGFYKAVKRLYQRAGVRVRSEKDPRGHIPYDLRDTFANVVEEAGGPSGREVTERLMGHESGKSIERYLVNRQPQELALYSPLRQLSRRGGDCLGAGSSTLPRLHHKHEPSEPSLNAGAFSL